MGSLNKRQIGIIIAIGVAFIVVIGMYLYNIYNQNETDIESELYEESEEIDEEGQEQAISGSIVIHIAGEVNSPGIVEVEYGSRIADVIEAADGLTAEANIRKINLAYIVEDGQKITIPSNEDIETNENFSYITKENGDNVVEGNTIESGSDTMININQATQTELEQLPGIGPSTALKIIEHRQSNGDFKTVEDIKNVSGIGDAKFEKIRDYISVK